MSDKIQISVPSKTFELRPMSELLSMVRNDLRQLDDEGMIDEGRLIKTVMACNERLGIYIRDIKQVCIPVEEFKAKLPLNFEKLYYVAALSITNTGVIEGRSPFNNNFDRDVLYEAELDRGTLGNVNSYSVTINRITKTTVHSTTSMIPLTVGSSSFPYCHVSCPNMIIKGKYGVTIEDDHIVTPFRSGELYIMYLSLMQDADGNILYPFHPLITPYYEWSIKEKVIMDAIFNSDGNYGELLKLAQLEKTKAWLDAFGITSDKSYSEYVASQRKKELSWYNLYFKYFQ